MKEIKTVKLGNKEYPISWGLNQTILYCELRNVSVSEYNEQLSNIANGTGAELRDLMWSGLKDGARRAKKDFNLDTFDVGDLMEELSAEDISSIINTMIDTLPKPKDEEASKKKVTKSSPLKS